MPLGRYIVIAVYYMYVSMASVCVARPSCGLFGYKMKKVEKCGI